MDEQRRRELLGHTHLGRLSVEAEEAYAQFFDESKVNRDKGKFAPKGGASSGKSADAAESRKMEQPAARNTDDEKKAIGGMLQKMMGNSKRLRDIAAKHQHHKEDILHDLASGDPRPIKLKNGGTMHAKKSDDGFGYEMHSEGASPDNDDDLHEFLEKSAARGKSKRKKV